MGLIALLEAWGGKLGVLEIGRGQTPQAPAKIVTRTVTLAELSTEILSEEVRALADQPSELSVPFDKIFETAGIKAGTGGWTVSKLHGLLTSEPYKDVGKEDAQRRVLETLRAEKVSAEEIVKDAMARDKVLDSFEVYAHKKMEDRRVARERKIAELRDRIAQFQKELGEAESRKKGDEENWIQWKARKKSAEQDMAWAIGFVIDRPVISITED